MKATPGDPRLPQSQCRNDSQLHCQPEKMTGARYSKLDHRNEAAYPARDDEQRKHSKMGAARFNSWNTEQEAEADREQEPRKIAEMAIQIDRRPFYPFDHAHALDKAGEPHRQRDDAGACDGQLKQPAFKIMRHPAS